jgi:hypothetical protein
MYNMAMDIPYAGQNRTRLEEMQMYSVAVDLQLSIVILCYVIFAVTKLDMDKILIMRSGSNQEG